MSDLRVRSDSFDGLPPGNDNADFALTILMLCINAAVLTAHAAIFSALFQQALCFLFEEGWLPVLVLLSKHLSMVVFCLTERVFFSVSPVSLAKSTGAETFMQNLWWHLPYSVADFRRTLRRRHDCDAIAFLYVNLKGRVCDTHEAGEHL